MAYSFDETFYLQNNPGVLASIRDGVFANGQEHFIAFGQFEGRMPNAAFDSAYYLATNPGVGTAVVNGAVESILDHYEQFGISEGRAFSQGLTFDSAWYLDEYPGVADAVGRGEMISAWQHFGLFGASQGFLPNDGAEIQSTFDLTIATDVATANQFNGPADGAFATLNSADNLTGVGANPTLTADLLDGRIIPTLSNISTINAASFATLAGGTGTLDFLRSDNSELNINNDGSASNITFANISLDSGVTTLGIRNIELTTPSTTTFGFENTSLAGNNDQATLVLDLANAGTGIAHDITIDNSTPGGTNNLENLDIVVDSNSVLGRFVGLQTGGVDTRSITISGDGDLSVGANLGDDVTSINGSSATGDLTLRIGSSQDTVFVGGVGDDDITSNVGRNTLTGGQGADTFTYTAVNQGNDTITDFNRQDGDEFAFLAATTAAGAIAVFGVGAAGGLNGTAIDGAGSSNAFSNAVFSVGQAGQALGSGLFFKAGNLDKAFGDATGALEVWTQGRFAEINGSLDIGAGNVGFFFYDTSGANAGLYYISGNAIGATNQSSLSGLLGGLTVNKIAGLSGIPTLLGSDIMFI